MKNSLTVWVVVALSFGPFTSGTFAGDWGGRNWGSAENWGSGGDWEESLAAWLEWYRTRGMDEPSGEVANVEQAALTITQAIVSESGGTQERYLDYSRRLAMTLNKKSKAELDRVFEGSNTLGLGS